MLFLIVACWQNISAYFEMTDFDNFYQKLLELAKSYEKKQTMLKINRDLNSDIIKIFGENNDSISKAKNGLEDMEELALTTAEHHPYWALLYNCSQISKTTLEKWDDELSNDDLDELEWLIAQLQNTCKKLKEQSSSTKS